jgi:hypothetical protein
LDKKTGILIPAGAEVSDIVEAVKYLTPEKCLEMKEVCEKRAHDFGLEEFSEKLRELVE